MCSKLSLLKRTHLEPHEITLTQRFRRFGGSIRYLVFTSLISTLNYIRCHTGLMCSSIAQRNQIHDYIGGELETWGMSQRLDTLMEAEGDHRFGI